MEEHLETQKCLWKIAGLMEDLFLGSQWSIQEESGSEPFHRECFYVTGTHFFLYCPRKGFDKETIIKKNKDVSSKVVKEI